MCTGLAEVPGLDLAVEPTGAYFVLVDVTGMYGRAGIRDAATFATRLLEDARVAVMPGADFGAPDHVRMSYAVESDAIDEALRRMRAFARTTLPEKEISR
jgi:aspartate aminotransferase